MNYSIFSYKEDYKCLEICINQIRNTDEDARIYIFDDAKKPLDKSDIPQGDDIFYKKTYFDRSGNLNGLECIRGMLACMVEIPGDGPIIKIDADTLLMSKDVFEKSLVENGKYACGFQCTISLTWCGACYGVSRKFIEDALDVMMLREFPVRQGQKYPEDQTLSAVALYLYGRSGVDILEFNDAQYLMGVRSCDRNDLLALSEIAKKVSAVHCGQVHFYHPIVEQSGCTIREACARVMWEILYPGQGDQFKL